MRLFFVADDVEGELFEQSAAALKWSAVEATQLTPCPVILVKVAKGKDGAVAAQLAEVMDAFKTWCEKTGGVVLFGTEDADIAACDEAFMARHGWTRARKPKFAAGARVRTERHGAGDVLSVEDMAGYGYCYRLRLDNGHSTGGMVPEDKLRELPGEAP